MYFCKIENFAYGEINERSFSNPQPCALKKTNCKLLFHLNTISTNCKLGICIKFCGAIHLQIYIFTLTDVTLASWRLKSPASRMFV